MNSRIAKFDFETPEGQEALGAHVAALFRGWMGHIQQNHHKRWLYLFRKYWGYQPPNPYDKMRSNITLPVIFTAVDTELPRHMQAMFATDPPVHARPDLRSVDMEIRAEAIINMIARGWARTGMREEVQKAALDAMLWGIGFLKSQWEYETDHRGYPRRDGPEWSRVSALDLAWDPAATRLKDTPLIQWRAVRLDHLKEMEANGMPVLNLDRIQEDRAALEKQYTLNDVYRSIGLTGPMFQGGMDDEGQEDNPWIVLGEYWDDDYVCLVELGSELPVLKPEHNPMGRKPYVDFAYKSHGDLLVGKSLADTLSGLAEAIDTYARLNVDNRMYGVHKMFFFDAASGLKKEDFIPMPNKAVAVQNPDGKPFNQLFYEYKGQEPNGGGDALIADMMGHVERASGQNQMLQGAGAERQQGYGETATMLQQTHVRYYLENMRWGDRLGQMADIDFRQYKSFQQAVRVVPMTGRVVPIEAVASNFPIQGYDMDGAALVEVAPGWLAQIPDNAFDWVPMGSHSLADRERTMNQILQLKAMLDQDPYIGVQTVPMADPLAVQAHGRLTVEAITMADVPNKDRAVREVRAAFDAAIQRYTMQAQMAAMMPQPLVGPDGQPVGPQEGAPPPSAGQQTAPPETLPAEPVEPPPPPMEMMN